LAEKEGFSNSVYKIQAINLSWIKKIRLKPDSIIEISKSYPFNILLYLIAKPSDYENSKEYSTV
jgi:hypothetical protein